MTSLNEVRKRRLTAKETSMNRLSLQVVDREQCVECALWFTNKRVQIKILSILKLVSFESLAGNDFSERGTQAEAHCERNLNRQLWSIRRKISHRCWRKLVSSLVGCLLLFLKTYELKIGGKLPRKILRQQKNRNLTILNSSAPSQNNETSRTSCRRLFENFLPSTPTEITFEISFNLARS